MDTSSAHYDSQYSTNLANLKTQLNIPSRDALFGLLVAGAQRRVADKVRGPEYSAAEK